MNWSIRGKRVLMNKKFVGFLVVITSLFWGLSFLATAILCEYMAPIQIQAVRWTIATIVFLALMAGGVVRIDWHHPRNRYLPLIGLCDPCIYMIFETYGIARTSSSVSSIFVATIPCMVLLLNIVMYGKRTNKMGILSIIMAFSGVVICTVFSPAFSIHGELSGYGFMMCAVVAGGMFSIVSSRLGEHFGALERTAAMAFTGAVFFNILNVVLGYSISTVTVIIEHPNVLVQLVFLGTCCSAFCYLAFNKLLGMMDPALANNISASTTTAVGVVAGIFLGGDPGGLYTVIGVIVTLAGVLLSSREI